MKASEKNIWESAAEKDPLLSREAIDTALDELDKTARSYDLHKMVRKQHRYP